MSSLIHIYIPSICKKGEKYGLSFQNKCVPADCTADNHICGGNFFVLIRLRFFFAVHPFATFRGMLAGGAGENSPLRVLSVSLAGTLGVGNIVGVAVAISLGGIGSVFWMWISALVSMVLKYAEIVLAMRYRSYSDGGCKGGPMYYMVRGIGGRLGRVLATVFCGVGVLASFCLGNIVQVSAAADSAERTFGLPKIIYGIIFAVLCALVIFGGFKKISSFTVVVMPLVCLIYIVLAMRIILLNLGSLPRIFSDIMQAAFTPASGASGIFGYLISGAVRHGTAKGTFSHEAGSGTAPMSHAQSAEQSAAKQGLYGIFEVFFDTIVICTMTALVIIISGFADSSLGSMDIVISAFEKVLRCFQRIYFHLFDGDIRLFHGDMLVVLRAVYARLFHEEKSACRRLSRAVLPLHRGGSCHAAGADMGTC